MILKPGPLFPDPGARIDGVIYFFGVPSTVPTLTPVAYDISLTELDYWDGSAWVALPFIELTAGVYPAGDGSLITDLNAAEMVPNFGNQDVTAFGQMFLRPANAGTTALLIEARSAQTAFLNIWRDGTGAFLLGVAADGSIETNFGRFLNTITGAVRIDLASPSSSALILTAAPSQTALIFQVKDSAGSILAYIDYLGDFLCAAADISGNCSAVRLYATQDGSQIGPYTTVDSLASLLVATTNAAKKPLVIQQAASPTVNALEIQDSAGAVLSAVDKDGVFSSLNPTAPSPVVGVLQSGVGTLDGSAALVLALPFPATIVIPTWRTNGPTLVGELYAYQGATPNDWTIQSSAGDTFHDVGWIAY